MSTLTITIGPKAAGHWPVVAEWLRPGDVGRITRNGRLALDLNTLRIRATPRAYGVDLGNALFTGAVRDTFLAARAAGVVHVRLDVRAADLQALHWQRLCAPGDGDDWDFLRLNQRTPYARLLPRVSDRQFRPLAAGDLRALVVVARPDDLLANGLDEFDAEATAAGLRRALGSMPHDVLGPVARAIGPATLDALCEQLTATHYTLLHIVCHGHYESETGDTFMYLCGPQNTTVAVSATDLLARLATLGALPHAVFLATCDTARPTAGDAMLNLAERLVRESRLGVPFVVAMAERVSIETAEALASKYYERLRAHGEPDVALTEACAGVQARYDVTVPMLFTAADGTALFAIQPSLPAGAPARSLHQLPSPPGDFTGRDTELAQLRAAFDPSRRHVGAAISALRGMGGVGKTALGLVIAHELSTQYPDAQLFFDLRGQPDSDNPAAPVEALAHVIRAFGPDTRLPDDEARLRAIYNDCLHDKHALVFMDNARDAAQVAPLIPPPSCALLVTSRQTFTLPGMQTVPLDSLPQADAEALLLAIAPRIGADAPTLANACARLPYALRIAGEFLANTANMRVLDYLSELQTQQGRLGLIEGTLALSYNGLTADQQLRWRQLAIFPDIFEEIAAAAVWGIELNAGVRKTATAYLADFLRFSLVTYDAAIARYRLHDLARVFADSRLADSERDGAAMRHARYYADLLAAADNLYLQGNDGITKALALYDREFANIAAGQSWSAARAASDDIAAGICNDYAGHSWNVSSLRLSAGDQIRWYTAALIASRRLNLHQSEGVHLGNLGIAYYQLGDVRSAIDYYEQQLVIAREIGDRRGEGSALGGLGNAHRTLGNARNAIDYYEQALVIDREIGDRRGEGTDLGDLGNAYYQLGDVRAAINHYEQQLVIAREIGDRRGESAALGGLGASHWNQGDNLEALDCYQRALTIVRAIGDRRGEASTLSNLGVACADLGNVRQAIDYDEQALAINREVGDPRGEGTCLYNLALAVNESGDHPYAIALMRDSLAIFVALEDPRAERRREQLREWGVDPGGQ